MNLVVVMMVWVLHLQQFNLGDMYISKLCCVTARNPILKNLVCPNLSQRAGVQPVGHKTGNELIKK